MRIGLTGIFVDDQDRAERFYTEVLGFQVKTSAAYGPGERWLSVVSPEEPDGGGAGAAPDRRADVRRSRPAGRARWRGGRRRPGSGSRA
jgi:catechol 2,3-dioxygenase-like lactoylglutathione lyase family enzyme